MAKVKKVQQQGDPSGAQKLTKEQYVLGAIMKHTQDTGWKGLFAMKSNFNRRFRSYFGCGKEEPTATTQAMAKAGLIEILPHRSKNGSSDVILYQKGDKPTSSGNPEEDKAENEALESFVANLVDA